MDSERYVQQIVYFLENNSDLSETAYKVMKTHESLGFIPCNYLYYNGKIKLVYNKAELVPLGALLNELSSDKFIEVVMSLFDLLINIREIGFLQYRNIMISLEKIFVDINNLKVSLIYFPLNIKQDIEFSDLERNVYTILSSIGGKYQNLCSEQYHKLLQLMMNNTSIDNIRREMKSSDRKDNGFMIEDVQMEVKPIYTPVYNPTETDNKKEKFSFFGRKKKEKNNIQEMDREYRIRVEGGATQILESSFVPQIKLKYVGRENLEIVINKEEFLIGKQEGSVDFKLTISNAISRVHCKIITINNIAYVEDLGSSNGTFVNGKRISSGDRIPLNQGDKVVIANQEFVVSRI